MFDGITPVLKCLAQELIIFLHNRYLCHKNIGDKFIQGQVYHIRYIIYISCYLI